MKTISVSAYAKQKNVSRQYITSLIRKGVLKKEKNGQLDPSESDRRITENRDIRRDHLRKTKILNFENKKRAGMKRKTQLDEALILKENMTAKIKELEYQERSGELVRASDIKRKAFELGLRVRERLLVIPDRMSSFNLAQRDELRSELDKALQVLS